MQRCSNGSDGEVILTGRLAEFRMALLHEIDAASRQQASSAIPLANGRRIGQVGGSYQYIFDIESSLNLPGDAPGDLFVPDRSPIEVVVVAIDGMVITLGVPEDLGPGVPCARLQSNLTLLMRRLIARIEEKAEIPNPSGDRILQGEAHGTAVKVDSTDFELNREQTEAVEASLGFDVTFIQGPPGTGKTRTIGALATLLLRQERSVLLVSHTNIAVDQALLKMADHIGPEERESGFVIRVGAPKDAQLSEHPDLLLSTHVEKRSRALVQRRTELESNLERAVKEVKSLCRKIELCEWVAQAGGDIEQMRSDLIGLHEKEVEVDRLSESLTQIELQRDYWSVARAEAQRAKQNYRRLAESDVNIQSMRIGLSECEGNLERLTAELSAAKVLLGQTCSVGWLMRRWRGWPAPDEQKGRVHELESSLAERTAESGLLRQQLATAEAERDRLNDLIQRFQGAYRLEPDGLLRKASAYEAKVEETRTSLQQTKGRFQGQFVQLRNLLRTRLAALIHLELAEDNPDSIDGMFEQIERAYECAARITRGVNLLELTARRDTFNGDIQRIEVELRTIEEDLKRVAELVIEDAKVVATTLTRAYLRDAIQGRRFDTVIVDEASMAPIPAVWIAASVAASGAVIVGDPRQLPPIVVSRHDLAQKWLGTDVFERAGIAKGHPHFRQLKEQYRMHPSISAIANTLIYGGELRDAEQTRHDGNLGDWYKYDWGHDSPVLLVDTGSLHAWVTSIPRNRGSSRLNFLSAAVCLDIAEQQLDGHRPKAQDGAKPRVLIVCPYRPHARLLELMVQDHGLARDIRAGTAHSFQGSEADVVIFDLVNDEPQWRVGMFMPINDGDMKRLLNVAITRARRRLVLVGDFEYIQKKAKKAFVGRALIPFLESSYPKVAALEIVKNGLAARAARAQVQVFGGEVGPPHGRIVVTETHFDAFFRNDLKTARERIVIYSPFITQARLSLLEPQLRSAVERGVSVYVVTKTHCERGKRELQQYRFLEQTLTEWGIVLVHKQGMHEKLIFVDADVLWEGSLNPLSFSSTGEHMERRRSSKVVAEYSQALRLNELIEEYAHGAPGCPICGSEVVAREGKDDPYFWRCVREDCYSRSIDQPTLKDGMITCSRCGGSVEYGQWGSVPAWRCLENRHHHQKVVKSDLRLPKMRALIPKA